MKINMRNMPRSTCTTCSRLRNRRFTAREWLHRGDPVIIDKSKYSLTQKRHAMTGRLLSVVDCPPSSPHCHRLALCKVFMCLRFRLANRRRLAIWRRSFLSASDRMDRNRMPTQLASNSAYSRSFATLRIPRSFTLAPMDTRSRDLVLTNYTIELPPAEQYRRLAI